MADATNPRLSKTHRPLVEGPDNAWTCNAYTASDFIEGFGVDNVQLDEIEAIFVQNNNDRFCIQYQAGLSVRDSRPYFRASTWRLTPSVFTPQARFIVKLRHTHLGPAAPVLVVYDVFVPPAMYDVARALLRRVGASALLGDGDLRVAAGTDGYDLLDGRGVRVNQF